MKICRNVRLSLTSRSSGSTTSRFPPDFLNHTMVMSEMLMLSTNQVFRLFWDDIAPGIARLNILSDDQGFEGPRGGAGKGGPSRRFEGFEGV